MKNKIIELTSSPEFLEYISTLEERTKEIAERGRFHKWNNAAIRAKNNLKTWHWDWNFIGFKWEYVDMTPRLYQKLYNCAAKK